MSVPAPSFPTRTGQAFWLLALAQACHSAEEMATGLYDFFWTATGRLHAAFPSFPQVRMAPATFAVLNMGFIALLFGAVPFVMARRRWALGVASAAGVIEIVNGANHLCGLFVFGRYVPGALTAPFLIAAGIAVFRARAKDRTATPLVP